MVETDERVVDGRRACSQRKLDIARRDIEWIDTLPRMPRPGESIVAITSDRGKRHLELRQKQDAASQVIALPIGAPLLERLRLRAYGSPVRADAHLKDGVLRVRCRSGANPAGIVLDPGSAHLPRQSIYRLVAEHRGDDGFHLSVTEPGADAGGGTRLGLHSVAARTRIAIGAMSKVQPVQFVLECPPANANIEILALTLESEAPAVVPTRSAWAWRPEQWSTSHEQLITAASALGIDRLHVSLEISEDGVRQQDALRRFIRTAAANGIAVDAVEGDPRMVRRYGRSQAIARAEAIRRYQRNAPADARLAGIQYDIEPYILPEFSADRVAVLQAWSGLVHDIGAALDMPLDIVVPFWFVDTPEGERALDSVVSRLRQVTVMAYRTDAAQVATVAEPVLAWGTRHRIPVSIALEMGRLSSETEERYVATRTGRLLVVPVGEAVVAMRLANATSVDGGLNFESRGGVLVPADRISFMEDAAQMMRVANALLAPLSAWPAFNGFAFHGLF